MLYQDPSGEAQQHVRPHAAGVSTAFTRLPTDSFLMLIFVRPAVFTQRIVGQLARIEWLALQLVAISIIALYGVGCHARWGCTLGKSIFGLLVATADGSIPPPLKNAFLRAFPILVIGNLDLAVGTFAPESWRLRLRNDL